MHISVCVYDNICFFGSALPNIFALGHITIADADRKLVQILWCRLAYLMRFIATQVDA